jgi:carboxyl-terminal processing protease
MEDQEEDDEIEEKKSMAELEVEARDKVREVFSEWFKNMDKLERADRFEVFVNTFTHAFDPHTDYFNPKDKEDFDMRMAGHFEGIGARLQTDGDFTKIVQIIPGGPAWKGKKLAEDDVILSVAQEGEDPVDIAGMRIDKVVTFIRGKKGTNVYLKVRKPDSSKEIIKITRDKVVTDDGKAVSLVLDQGHSSGNIGYLWLPSFYADFGDKNGRSSATDVAKELENLKAQNVNGIILDLRNNGGGSFKDVVDMSGFFIEKGPIVQAKSRGRNPYPLKDTDPTVNYDGPLIVMVNGYSASASEILAAALQDYKRAVIVGSTSTYGKGTVQRFFDLDRGIQGAEDLKPLGELKLTTQKFYRINGGSTQLRGVTPDIFLPDNFQFVKTGEKDTDYPLEWTKIEPVEYEQNVRIESNLVSLKKASEARVAKNEIFNKILDNAKRFEKLEKETIMPLNYKAFDELSDAREAEAKKYKDIKKEIPGLEVRNIESYLEEIAIDSAKIDRNIAWIENIKKDVYLEETINIMRDMISAN